MKILVTGASGFIGRNLTKHLVDRYEEVFIPNRIELDLLDEMSVLAYLKNKQIDVVIHSAGKPGHRNAIDPTGIFHTDTRMYYTLVHHQDYFGKLLITGSGGIYDLRNYRPKMKEEEWIDHLPADEHGFFRYVTAHHIENTRNVIDLRLFGVFGKYEDYAIRFISNAICKTLFDLPITIRQNRKFDYLYINDFFPVIDYFVSHESRYHSYNVTPDHSITLLELAELILRIAGKDLPIQVCDEGMGLEYSGDNSRLRGEIPGLQFTRIENAVAELYDWYLTQRQFINRDALLVDK